MEQCQLDVQLMNAHCLTDGIGRFKFNGIYLFLSNLTVWDIFCLFLLPIFLPIFFAFFLDYVLPIFLPIFFLFQESYWNFLKVF